MASRTTTALLVTAAMVVVVAGARLPSNASVDNYVVEDVDGPSDAPSTTGSVETVLVGDEKGWNLQVDYIDWASYETLNVGDILEFKYQTGGLNPHNVVQMLDKASFDACTVPTSNSFTYTSGDDVVPLTYTGMNYFISSLYGDCQSGMKLSVNVAA